MLGYRPTPAAASLPWPVCGVLAGAAGTAALTLSYALGRTPPPWRWPRGFLATSFATHAACVAAVAAVDDGLSG